MSLCPDWIHKEDAFFPFPNEDFTSIAIALGQTSRRQLQILSSELGSIAPKVASWRAVRLRSWLGTLPSRLAGDRLSSRCRSPFLRSRFPDREAWQIAPSDRRWPVGVQ